MTYQQAFNMTAAFTFSWLAALCIYDPIMVVLGKEGVTVSNWTWQLGKDYPFTSYLISALLFSLVPHFYQDTYKWWAYMIMAPLGLAACFLFKRYG